jgi:methyltransferase
MIWFTAGMIFLIVQRLFELRIARRNTRRLLKAGGREFGRGHYPLIVVLHALFFASMILEVRARGNRLLPLFAVLFLLAQAGRIWVIRTLGERWTTRVIVLRGEKLVASGPFRIVKHPNYLFVTIEFVAFPMIFGLSYTAVIFTLLNLAVLLFLRIPVENRALEWSQGELSTGNKRDAHDVASSISTDHA